MNNDTIKNKKTTLSAVAPLFLPSQYKIIETKPGKDDIVNFNPLENPHQTSLEKVNPPKNDLLRDIEYNVPKSSLHISIQIGYTARVKALCDDKVLDVNMQLEMEDGDKLTPLALCVLMNTTKDKNVKKVDEDVDRYYRIANILLKNGANPNLTSIHKGKGTSPLLIAVEAGDVIMVSTLLKNGAEPNQIVKHNDTNSMNLLHIAVMNDDLLTADRLLNKGANPNFLQTREINRVSPLHLAVMSGNEDMVSLLLKYKANVNLPSWNIQNTKGALPLCIAILKMQVSMVKLLLDNNADPEIGRIGTEGKYPSLIETAKTVREKDFTDCKTSNANEIVALLEKKISENKANGSDKIGIRARLKN
jgi:ankyrin repeat protein